MMIYIHIPFCAKKCSYCDFLSFSGKAAYWDPYVRAVCNELAAKSHLARESITSIYIGGGTPSILSIRNLNSILEAVYSNYTVSERAEVTLECNPATVTKDSAKSIASLPINRISIGLQSAMEDELRLLGRIHTWSDFLLTYESFLKAGIDNLNVDIMTGIPKQTVASLENTLKSVLALRPAHVSTYALILEEGTLFNSIYKKGQYPLPDEDGEYELYKTAINYLENHGYERYEISNYARPGRESRHNLGYWERAPYIGIGLGASSFYNHTRYKNLTNIDSYIGRFRRNDALIDDSTFSEISELSLKDEMAEFMYLGLRKKNGILISDFEDAFNERLDTHYYRVIEKLTAQGHLIKSFGRIRLTKDALDISNQILWEFLPDS